MQTQPLHFPRFTCPRIWGQTLVSTSLAGLTALLPVAPSVAQSSFADIRGHWSQLCVQTLARDNIVSGFTDAQFRPDAPLTRGLYADMLSRAFPNVPQLQPMVEFWDLSPTDPFYDVITTTTQQGFFSGSQGRFGAHQPIDRQNFFVALANGLEMQPTDSAMAILEQTYDDGSTIVPYAQAAVAALTQRKWVVSALGVRQFRPQDPITRGEAAAVFCQVRGSGLPATGVPTAFVVDPPSHPETYTERRVAVDTNVVAQLTYTKKNYEYGRVRLTVSQGEQTQLDQLLPLGGGFSRNVGLQLYDLDGDGGLEIVVDGVAGEGRCCSRSLIYTYLPRRNAYNLTEVPWGYGFYRLLDWDQDGIPEFHGQDSRFSFRFGDQVEDGVLPLQIQQYRQGQMFDVTRLYPQLLTAHAEGLWQTYVIRRARGQEVKGVLAAYAADRFLLNEGDAAFDRLSSVYDGADRSRYFQDLRDFLRGTGYTNY